MLSNVQSIHPKGGRIISITSKSKIPLIIGVVAVVAVIIAAAFILTNDNEEKQTYAVMHTNMGDIEILLYDDTPITSGNFESLVEKGFYNGITFHRVVKGFVIQAGDPTGTGYGGCGYTIPDEFVGHSNVKGTIAMANAGPNTGGSQFFINLVDNTYLDSKHPVFGEVVSGMDVALKIADVGVNGMYKPLTDVVIVSVDLVKK